MAFYGSTKGIILASRTSTSDSDVLERHYKRLPDNVAKNIGVSGRALISYRPETIVFSGPIKGIILAGRSSTPDSGCGPAAPPVTLHSRDPNATQPYQSPSR